MGQAELGGDSFPRADRHGHLGGGGDRDHGRARLGRRQGTSALHLEGMAHQRRPQAHRRDVRRARPGDAAARLRRRDHDALAAGRRHGQRRLPAAGALQPDLLGARHDHDLLRRHAVRDRADELRRAAAARRPRRRLSRCSTRSASGSRPPARCWSTSRCSSASSRAPAGCRIRRSPSSPTRPASASTTTCGRCRSRASARCCPASTW